MKEQDLIEKINSLIEDNTEESINEAIKLIDSSTISLANNEYSKKMAFLKNTCQISLLQIELTKLGENPSKEKIATMGRLIKAYSERESLALDEKAKMDARYQKIELMKQQKDSTKDYRQNDKSIKIPEKVSLLCQEIASTIKIFAEKKDVLTKVKKIVSETVIGASTSTILLAGVTVAASLALGVGLSLSSFTSVVPTVAYIGLSSVIRNLLTKTKFEQYEHYQSPEYQKYVEEFKKENKDLLTELDNALKGASSEATGLDKIDLNEQAIQKLDEVCAVAKDQGLRQAYELQALGFLRENKQILKSGIDDYLDEKNDDLAKYKEYHQKLAKLNIEIFKRENSLKDAVKSSVKNFGLSMTVMVIAKAIITAIAPKSTYALRSLTSLEMPAILALTNAITEIPLYRGKLKYKETSENVKVDPEEKEQFDKLFGNTKELQAA